MIKLKLPVVWCVFFLVCAFLLTGCELRSNDDDDNDKQSLVLGANGPTPALADPEMPAGGWKTSGNMLELEPMRNQFKDYFPLFGNIAVPADYSGGKITNKKLLRHYNVLTAENHMKPDTYGGSRSNGTVAGLTYTNSDAFVNAARASGFAVHAHVLLWHQQNSNWIKGISSVDKATAIAAMQSYITQVVTHFKGKVYSWDVLNEVFPDTPASGADWKTAMRTDNPWFAAIGADFVFEGFKAARLADSTAILYYNDYNMDNANKAGAVERMVRDVNNQWKTDPAYDNRLLIEGIGMQSHHNTNVTAAQIKASLDKFKPLGVRIAISELDVLCGAYSGTIATSGPSKVTSDTDRTKAANLYGEYFKLFLEYSDIIERVTFWGVYDEQSWRSAGEPLPFKGNATSTSKPAYDKIMQALTAHKNK